MNLEDLQFFVFLFKSKFILKTIKRHGSPITASQYWGVYLNQIYTIMHSFHLFIIGLI